MNACIVTAKEVISSISLDNIELTAFVFCSPSLLSPDLSHSLCSAVLVQYSLYR